MQKIVLFALLLGARCAVAGGLLEAVHEVVDHHPDTVLQRANLSAAEKDVEIAKQQYWPTPSVALEQAQSEGSDLQYKSGEVVAVFRLQQPVWTGGRLAAGVGKAEAIVEVRRASVDEARLRLALTTVEVWAAWCAAEARLAVVEDSARLHRALQDKVARRVQEGASAPTELTMTEGRVALVEAQISMRRAERATARSRLTQLLGRPLASDACPAWPTLKAEIGADVITPALAQSPALSRLRAQVAQVRFETQEREADLWPEVYVRAEHQRGNFSGVNNASTSRIFFGVNSRLGAGASTLRQVEMMALRQQAAEQELEGGRRQVIEQVSALDIQWQDIQRRLPALAQQVRATTATQQAWDRQFLAGKKSWLDVMNAAREAMQAALDWAEARENEQSLAWRLALMVRGVDRVLTQGQAALQ